MFCCESQEICDTISQDSELMRLLFSFVETDQPLHHGLAGYFGRVVCSLLFKSGAPTLKYLQDNPAVLENLLNHMSSSSIGEIIIRVAASDEEWVAQTNLVESLLDKLAPGKPVEEQVKAAEVLCGINTDIYEFKNPVKQKLYNRANVERLCMCAFEATDKIMVRSARTQSSPAPLAPDVPAPLDPLLAPPPPLPCFVPKNKHLPPLPRFATSLLSNSLWRFVVLESGWVWCRTGGAAQGKTSRGLFSVG